MSSPCGSLTRRALLKRGVAASAALTTGVSFPQLGCGHPLPTTSQQGSTAPALKGVSLRDRAAHAGILFGCAVAVKPLRDDPAYAEAIRLQAGILVAENAMKWGPLRPTPTTYFFEDSDYLLAFAERNRMKMRGHNLCWHRQLPGWFAQTATPQNAKQLLTEHIETVAGRYSGRMQSWDVVNEAVQIADGRADGLRKSPWLTLLGDDYIELAFQTARRADPRALLAYNDYGIEGESDADEKKRTAVLLLLRRLVARKVPIDALGIQSHLTARANVQPRQSLLRFMAAVRELGLQIFLTEMDVNDRELPPSEGERDAAVAATYGSYLDSVFTEPAVRAVLTWGITDRYTWLNKEDARTDKLPERPLPLDRDYRTKPAFTAMADAFAHRGIPARRTAS